MLSQDDLNSRIARFIKRHGISDTSFGKMAAGDPTLVFELRGEGSTKKPRQLSLRMAQKLLDFMASYEARAREERRAANG